MFLCEKCLSVQLHKLNRLIEDFHCEIKGLNFNIECEKCHNNKAEYVVKLL